MDEDEFIEERDIENYKLPWESTVEWKLRRKFICNHRNKFPESRLICLSQVFANVEFLGCSYPAQVMEEIETLSEGLVEEYRARKEEERRIMFVKAEEEKKQKHRDETVNTKDLSCKYPGFIRAASPDSNTSNKPTLPVITNPLNDMTKPSLDQVTSIAPSTNLNPSWSEASFTKPSSNGPTIEPLIQTLNSSTLSARGSVLPTRDQQEFKNRSLAMTGRSLPIFQSNSNFNQYMQPKKQPYKHFEDKLLNIGTLLKERKGLEPNILQLMDVCMNMRSLKLSWDIQEHRESPKVRSPVFTCTLFCNSIMISYARGMNKKNARINAYKVAFDKLTKPYLKIVLVNGKNEIISSDYPINDNVIKHLIESQKKNMKTERDAAAAGLHLGFKRRKTINDLVIVERMEQYGSNALSVMQESADFSRIELKYEYDIVQVNGQSCNRASMYLDGQLAAEGIDFTKLKAKLNAADAALKRLKELRPTVRVKTNVDINAPEVSRDELVVGESNKINEQIPDDNLGNKMLRRMGWTGGGVGKVGNEGIEEPVKAVHVYGREGLGLSSEHTITKQFLMVIEGVIKTYARCPDEEDMTFSPEFSKEERAAIHHIALRYNLKSVSRGKGASRFLVLSRKRNPIQLLQHLQQSGGVTSKFELIRPQKSHSTGGYQSGF